MPAPQLIDWPGIRANAMELGVRGAARQAAADLPTNEQARFVERVLKRSAREGWIVQKNKALQSVGLQIVSNSGPPAKPLSSKVLTGADSMANTIAELGKRTKMGLMTAVSKAADTFADKNGEVIIEQSQELRHVTAAAATLHGWNDDKSSGLTLNLGIMLGNMQ